MISNSIVVDDDAINNMICLMLIKHVFPETDAQTFTDPEMALMHIRETYAKKSAPDVVLFLDINMPILTGWEFLDVIQRFDPVVKEHLKIYMLSSSIDPGDKQRAASYNNVLDCIEKPLTSANVQLVLGK